MIVLLLFLIIPLTGCKPTTNDEKLCKPEMVTQVKNVTLWKVEGGCSKINGYDVYFSEAGTNRAIPRYKASTMHVQVPNVSSP